MSQKSDRTVIRSKIPRFQGSRKTSTKTELLKNPRKNQLTQRKNITDKPGHLINTSKADKNETPSNDGDVPFEPDPQALDSILSNKGINFGATRASEMTPSSSVCHQVPVNRLSMWESLNEFKENLRKYKDTFQHWNGDMRTDRKPQTPTDNYKKSAALTPRSGRTLPEPSQMSLMQSYEQHKENIKIFREKMQNVDGALQTSRPTAGNNGECTPKQGHLGLTNTARGMLSATPVNNRAQRAWTEFKENRPPHVGTNRTAAFSTSKINPSKLCAIDETSSDFSCTSQAVDECHSFRPVRRALLLSSGGNEATEKTASLNGYDKAAQKYCKNVESYQPVAVSSSVKDHLVQHSLYSNCSSSEDLPPTSGLVFKSPDIIQTSRIIPIFLTPKSPFPSGAGNAVSSTECTWSCQQTLCTPRPTASERIHEVAHNFHSIHNTQTFSKSTADSVQLLSSNTPAVTSIESAATFLHTYRTSQEAKTAFSTAGDFNNYFNQLRLNSGPSLSTAVSSQSSISVPKLWQGATPPVLKTSVPSTPVRALRGNTFMSDSPSFSTVCPRLTVTPQSQMWKDFVRDQRSPATSLLLSSQSARRNEAVASCLKNRELSKLDNTDGMPIRYAVSSVKKLRWADAEDCVEH